MIRRFRWLFNSANRATTRFRFVSAKCLVRKRTFNYRKQNKHGDAEGKISRAEMFARRRIIFCRSGLIFAKVKGDKKWCNC